ncbi:BYPASS1-LIKE-like protein, partial [Drosera capensis]
MRIISAFCFSLSRVSHPIRFPIEFSPPISNPRAHAQLSKPPLDHAVTEYLDKNLKALDICNAIRDGIEKVRQWGNQIEFVLRALDYQQKGTFSEPQFRRAKKALMEMALMMLDEKEGGSILSNRNRSFGRHNASKDNQNRRPGHSRSLSWSVSHSWSASKQLQAIANNLVPPQRNEPLATSVFLMSCVRLFVLWVLVAAIPCQDRSLQCSFPNLRQFYWGAPLHLLHNRILDESKRRDKRNSHGLLKEITNLEKLTHKMTDLVDSAEFPLEDSQKAELVHEIEELAAICGVLKSGLEPLEVQVRE